MFGFQPEKHQNAFGGTYWGVTHTPNRNKGVDSLQGGKRKGERGGTGKRKGEERGRIGPQMTPGSDTDHRDQPIVFDTVHVKLVWSEIMSG